MDNVVEYLKKLALAGEDIIDETKLKKLIWYLTTYFNLESYVKNVKTQHFPFKPEVKIFYDIRKLRIEYYMWPIIKESEKISQLPLDEYDKILYKSLKMLILIRREIEHILEIYYKSENCSCFESSLLHLILKVYKLYLKHDLSDKENNDLYTMEKIYHKNRGISPLERLANYYSYQDVLNQLSDGDAVKELIKKDYELAMEEPYKITDSPTMDYIKLLRDKGLIRDSEKLYLEYLATYETDAYKYGLILPK